MNRPSVYLAGSTNDMGRVTKWRDRLTHEFSFIDPLNRHPVPLPRPIVQAHWLDGVKEVGAGGNPADASRMDRSRWAMQDLIRGVEVSDVLWLMRPPDGLSSHGAYFECGFAFARRVPTVVSGPRKVPSIFDALAMEFAEDEQAFEWVLRYLRVVPESIVVPVK